MDDDRGTGVTKKPSKASVKKEAADEAASTVPVDPVAGKSVAEIFGEIVWLMSQDKEARELPIKDLEWLVMPPILLRQFHITYAPVPDGRTVKGEPVRAVGRTGDAGTTKPRLQPVAVELYAMCSEAVAAALEANPSVRLGIQDWRSGTRKIILRKYLISPSFV
jgi:hemolysin-activating ACP:hemolysin acyltransferase